MIEVTELKNGMKVAMEYLPYLRTVSFGIWVHVGSINETKQNNGISHMIEHMLFKGTHKHTAKQIADIISSIGDDVNAFTGKDVTCYYGSTVTEFLPILVELFAEMLRDSCFYKEDIRKEKRVIYDEIDMYEDSPEDLVHELLQQKIYRDHPLGYIISGNKTNVKSFTEMQIRSFMKEHYTADNITISIAGNFNKEEFLQILEKEFSFLVPKSNKASKISEKLKKDSFLELDPYQKRYGYKQMEQEPLYHRCFCTRHKDIEQLHINLAFPSITLNSEKNYVCSIFNSVLGGSNNSRLFQRIREELGLTYSIYSYGSSFESTGLFHIDITVNPSQAEVVFDKVIEVMSDLNQNGITNEELITHRAQVITEMIMGSESAKSRMNNNAKSLMLRDFIRDIEEVIEKLNQVTLEEVNQFANEILCMNQLSVCLVGPKNDSFQYIKKKWKRMI